MKRRVVCGDIDQSDVIFIQDSSSSTGAGLTGLVYNSAGLTAYYARPLVAAAAITLVTQTVTGAHTDGGFVEIDATNLPGFYRIDWLDAMFAADKLSVAAMLKGATNMAPLPMEFGIRSLQDMGLMAKGVITVTDPTHFVLSNSSDNDDDYTDMVMIVRDVTNSPSVANLDISAYNGTTNEATLVAAAPFTVATGDTYEIVPTLKVPTVAEYAAGFLDLTDGVESGLTPRQYMRLTAAALFGLVSNNANNNPKFRDTNNTKNRITANTTSDGDRTSVGLDSS